MRPKAEALGYLEAVQIPGQQQIPGGNDRKKSKGKATARAKANAGRSAQDDGEKLATARGKGNDKGVVGGGEGGAGYTGKAISFMC